MVQPTIFAGLRAFPVFELCPNLHDAAAVTAGRSELQRRACGARLQSLIIDVIRHAVVPLEHRRRQNAGYLAVRNLVGVRTAFATLYPFHSSDPLCQAHFEKRHGHRRKRRLNFIAAYRILPELRRLNGIRFIERVMDAHIVRFQFRSADSQTLMDKTP